ncbi:MAG: hypothetical protein QOE05_3016 [Actinomycetota bacterium]|nr:hypothetical protein [Actinomycetota bacterium]
MPSANAVRGLRTYGHIVPADALLEGYDQRLAELCKEFDVPGASVGLLDANGVASIATGVTNIATHVPTTPDTLFQIGSISKVYTATLVLRLADEGRIDLDAPVATLLPELSLGAQELQEGLTTRHLLTHTSGLDGDVFDDTGRGDDCLQRYVELLSSVGTCHPLGARFSYCNSGFVLAGRLLEHLHGAVWDEVLRSELLDPLGASATVTLPEEALLFRTAVSHVQTPDGALTPSPVWTYARALGPAGLICATAGDLLEFARLHLRDGATRDGHALLAPSTARAMRDHEVDVPAGWPGDSWGLGWIRYDWPGGPVVGHDGGTIGQRAHLRLVPSTGVAVAVLTNAPGGTFVARAVLRELLGEYGVQVPGPVQVAPRQPEDAVLARHVGRYGRTSETWDVSLDDNGLVATMSNAIVSGRVAAPQPVSVRLEWVEGSTFVHRQHDEMAITFTFAGDAEGRSTEMFTSRLNLRMEQP